MDSASKQIFIFVDFSFSPDEKIDDEKCSAVGCPGTDLTDLNTYFSQYVLEKSNASNYFNVYVAGFSFGPKTSMPVVKPSNMTSNMTNNTGIGPANKTQETPTEGTVWYSNEVHMTLRTMSYRKYLTVHLASRFIDNSGVH